MATRSLNKVQLIGNLTRDPELRYTPQGTAVCTFGLATNRSWVTEAGERKEETEFHRIVAWNKLAELCAQLLFKGRRIFVEGRLQTRTWTSQDGSQRQVTEIVIEDMIILDNRRAPEGQEVQEPEIPEEKIDTAPEPDLSEFPVEETSEGGNVIEEAGEEDSVQQVASQTQSDDITKQTKKKKTTEEKEEIEEKSQEEKKEELNPDDIPF